MLFAFLTVLITVHTYVFYSLYVLHGETFLAATGAPTVLAAIRAMGGVSLLGRAVPIWTVVLTEFVLAYSLELALGSPLSLRLVSRTLNPRAVPPAVFETGIIIATVVVMCPAMSFLAAILYYPWGMRPFHLLTLLANWLQLICCNLPFAFFSQLFFIQPLVRLLFRLLCGLHIRPATA